MHLLSTLSLPLLTALLAVGVGLLPQSWLPLGILSFRRDWGLGRQFVAAQAAALTLTAGGLVLAFFLRPTTPSQAAGIIAGTAVWRMILLPRREELWRQGRLTRAPLGLALLLTGPSELGAWLFTRVGFSLELITLWVACLGATLFVQTAWGARRVDAHPELLARWIPGTSARSILQPEAVLAAGTAGALLWSVF